MNINKVDNSLTFGQRAKMMTVEQKLKKMAESLGTTPEMLVGAGSVASLSSSALALGTGNYSGLEKFLPINISIPLGSGIASTVGYRSSVNTARAKLDQMAKNAKRRGEEVLENQTDPDFIKAIFMNLRERIRNLGKPIDIQPINEKPIDIQATKEKPIDEQPINEEQIDVKPDNN